MGLIAKRLILFGLTTSHLRPDTPQSRSIFASWVAKMVATRLHTICTLAGKPSGPTRDGCPDDTRRAQPDRWPEPSVWPNQNVGDLRGKKTACTHSANKHFRGTFSDLASSFIVAFDPPRARVSHGPSSPLPAGAVFFSTSNSRPDLSILDYLPRAALDKPAVTPRRVLGGYL